MEVIVATDSNGGRIIEIIDFKDIELRQSFNLKKSLKKSCSNL